MNANEWKKVVRPLIPPNSCWEFRRTLCYETPFDWILHGAMGEPSRFDKGMYVWKVTMPLFVPADYVDAQWSSRVGGYAVDDVGGMSSAISLALTTVESEADALSRIAEKEPTRNLRVVEASAYARVIAYGDTAVAIDLLDRAKNSKVAYGWVRELVDRMLSMSQLLQHEGNDAALAQLRKWRNRTASAIGLSHAPLSA